MRRSAPGTMVLAILLGCRASPPEQALDPLPPVDRPEPPAPWKGPLRAAAEEGQRLDPVVALLDQGRRALADGRHEAAGRLFRQAREVSPALADWARLLEARARAEEGAIDDVDTLLTHGPPDLVILRGWEASVRARVVQGRIDEASARLQEALDGLPYPGTRGSAEMAGVDLCLSRDDETCAREGLARILSIGATDGVSERAATRLEALGPRTPEEYRAVFDFHLRRGNLAKARATADDMGRSSAVPASDARRAALDETIAVSRRRSDEEVVRRLLALADGAPEASLRSRAALAAGRVRVRQGRTSEARTLLDRAVQAEPQGSAAQEALFLLGDLEQDAGRRSVAAERFRQAVMIDSGSEWGGEAATRLGGLLYQDGDALGAAAVFEALGEAHSLGWRFQQATFWAGMAYRRMGERETAQLRFAEADAADPAGYYGMRAREVGGGPSGIEGIGEGPPPDAEEALLARGGLLRVEALRRAGLGEEADVERARLHRLLSTLPTGPYALAEAYHERGRLLEAVRVGREIRREVGRWDLRLLRIVFPLPYREEILRHSDRAGVDPHLTAALIRQESLFQPDATSPAGAVGLMQLQPRVAGSLAIRANVPPPSAVALREPSLNLQLGTLHLGDLLRRHGPRLDEALVAYNAGPARLADWRSFPEHADPDQFLERIPYRETREYIRTVLESVPIYAKLHGGKSDIPGAEAPTDG